MLRLSILSSFAILFALVLGCSDSTNDAQLGEAVPSTAPGELRLSLPTEPNTLDPARVSLTADLSILRQLFRGLLWYDEDLALAPMVAKEVPTVGNKGIAEDGLIYRFKLRDDFKWSDGRTVVAGDFEYAIKRLLDPTSKGGQVASYFDIRGAETLNGCVECSAARLAELRQEVGVRATDDTTLVFTLHQPRATFLQLLAHIAASPIRRDIVEKYGDKWTDAENIVSNGPFVLKEWVRGERIVLEPNADWQGNKLQLTRVTFRIIPDPVQAFNAYIKGDLDVVDVQSALQQTVIKDPVLVRESLQLPSLHSYAFFLNRSHPPFDNEKVRKALSLAIDRESIVNNAQGEALVTHGWLPPGMPGYDKNAGTQWKFDPAKARSMLAEAGYSGGAGLPPITFTFLAVGPNPKIAAALQQQLQENLGISIQLKGYSLEERTQWREVYLGRKLQMVFTGIDTPYPDPEGMFVGTWTCQRYEGNACISYGTDNFAYYANPQFDLLISRAAKEPDTKRRISMYNQAQRMLIEDAPAIFTSYRTRYVLIKPYVEGRVQTAMDNVPMELFLDKVSTSN